MLQPTLTTTVAALITLGFLRAICVAVYRVYYHPLARIPGPQLAPLTGWFATYYDCFCGAGSKMVFRLREWHEKYGPIIRIGPNEVHVSDPGFYVDVLYTTSRHNSRPVDIDHRFAVSQNTFSTGPHLLHRQRRAALNPLFSKQRTDQFFNTSRAVAENMSETIRKEFLASGNILSLNQMWSAYSTDITLEYTLDESYDYASSPGFNSPISNALVQLFEGTWLITHFPLLAATINGTPNWIKKRLSASLASFLTFREDLESKIERVVRLVESKDYSKAARLDRKERASIVSTILESSLPKDDISITRIQHEALGVIFAGMETTSNALSTGCYHILSNSAIQKRLVTELTTAIPDKNQLPDLDALYRLPYLAAVVEESFRLSYGAVARLPRHSPTPIEYQGFVLPPSVMISMDAYNTHHDEAFFPNSFEFKPERWLDNPLAPNGKPLSRYMVAFSKGTRSCLGINQAYANMFLGLSTLFRRFQCELFETDRECVDAYRDCFVPKPKPGTLGVRVLVTGERD